MTTFEKVLKILDSFALNLIIVCGAIIVAAWLFPDIRNMILSMGSGFGVLVLFLFMMFRIKDNETNPRPRSHR